MESPPEVKENSIEIAQGESLESFFARLIESNQDIPETYLLEFCNFLDRQSQAFKQIKTIADSDAKRAKELGFESGEEFRKHLVQEQKYRTHMEVAQIQDNKHHVVNVYASEAAFFEANMAEIVYIRPALANVALLGTHSHQILSDLIYTTCREMDRQLVGSIMEFFQVVDIQQLTADIGPEPVEPDSEESDPEE